jgi:hypothetical protein
MPCALLVEGSRHGGRVRDLSATGLFVETEAEPDVGTSITLVVTPPDGGRAVRVVARVARRERGTDRGLGDAMAGVGIDIEDAPEHYYGVLATLMGGAASDRAVRSNGFADPPSTVAPEVIPRFRVRIVRSTEGWQTRTVILSAPSEGEACRMAVAAAGPGWRVDLCERG